MLDQLRISLDHSIDHARSGKTWKSKLCVVHNKFLVTIIISELVNTPDEQC